MIVVDTSIWIDYVNGVITPQTDILDRELQENRVVTGDLIITEFLQSFRNDKQLKIAKMMDSLQYHDFVGKKTAIKATQNFRMLSKKGVTIRKTIDMLIATFCLEHGFGLLHKDKDYDPMEAILGLQVKR